MAEDWIKVRSCLARHPKVILMADLLLDHEGLLARSVSHQCMGDMNVTRDVTRCATIGACVTVWSALRHRGYRVGDDLVVDRISKFVVDDIAGLPGFGEAMEDVGWLIETDENVRLPRFFEELNVDNSKAAQRQKAYRDRKKADKSVTSRVTSRVTTEESKSKKRVREENKKPPKSPTGDFDPTKLEMPFPSADFVIAWADFSKMRREIRKPLRETGAKASLKKLGAMGEARSIAALEHTTANEWQGIREPEQTNSQPKPETDEERHAKWLEDTK